MPSKRLTLLLVVVQICFAAPAAAAVNGFEGGDGDQTSADCAAVLDWQCLTAAQMLPIPDGTGAGDDTFVDSKEISPNTWNIAPGGTASKVDVRHAWVTLLADAERRTYMNLAFRLGAGDGNKFLGIELNQARTRWVNSLGHEITCRTDGDALVSYEVDNPPVVKVYEWSGSGGPPSCPDGAVGNWIDEVVVPASGLEARLNMSRPIDNFLSIDSEGTSFGTATFGEASIDLRAVSDAIQWPGSACEYFRQAAINSRASSSMSAALEDRVEAIDVSIRACETPAADTGGGDGSGSGDGSGDGSGSGEPPADTVAPTTPTMTAEKTDPTTVVLSGTTEPGATVVVYDGTLPVGIVTAGSDGAWSLTLPNLADGTHRYTADATDTAGNTSAASSAVTVVVDTAAPAAPAVTAMQPEPGTVMVGGNGEPGAVVEISDNGVIVETTTVGTDGTWAVTLTDVPAGNHTYTAVLVDTHGNRSDASTPVTLTAVAPADGGGSTGGGTTGGDTGGSTGGDTTGGDTGGSTTGGDTTGGDTGGSTTGGDTTGGDTGGSTTGGDTTGGDTGSSTGGDTTGGQTETTPVTPDAGTGGPIVETVEEALLGDEMRQPQGCMLKRFRAVATYRRAKRVTFLVNGRKVRTVRRADRHGRFTTMIEPANYGPGTHRLAARIKVAGKRKPRLVQLRFRSCADKCLSRRSFRIRLKAPAGDTVVQAVVLVNGKRVKVVRGKRLKAPVNLMGLPKGRVTVTVRGRTAKGKVVTDTRHYLTCTKRQTSTKRPRRR